MFRFENESFLYYLFVIVFFVIIYSLLYYRDKRRFAKYCDKQLFLQLVPQRSRVMPHIKFSLLMLALACFIIAAANPQSASKVEKGKRKGVDIMICLDVSNSMLAEDIQPNRLESSKMAISHFIDKLQGDRVGLVVFAGTSFVQLPITTDYAAAKMFVKQINTDLISAQGTDISAALLRAKDALVPDVEKDAPKEKSQNNKTATSKVILLASDGEDHVPESVETATQLAEEGIVIHTIGIGSSNGTPIPISKGKTQYKKDQNGNTVTTRLNEQVLQDIAAHGKGVYVHAVNSNMGFENILTEINNMEKTEFKDVNVTRYDSYFQYPLGLGLIFLLFESFLFVVKPKWQSRLADVRLRFGGRTAVLLLLSLMTFSCSHNSKDDDSLPSVIQEGNKAFQTAENLRNKEKATIDTSDTEADTSGFYSYSKALDCYDKAIQNEPINQNYALFNQIDAFYRQHRFDTIDSIANHLKDLATEKPFLANVDFNVGNALMQQHRYSDAAEHFKDALRKNPNDLDAKYNLVYAQKMIRAGKNQPNQGQNKQDQKQGNNNQNNQQNKDQQGQDNQQNKDQQGQNKDKNQGQNGQQNKDKKQGQGGQSQESPAQKEKREAMARQLDALQQNEKRTQDKVNKQKIYINPEDNKNGQNRKQDKDW